VLGWRDIFTDRIAAAGGQHPEAAMKIWVKATRSTECDEFVAGLGDNISTPANHNP
jgi:hypothetical protein